MDAELKAKWVKALRSGKYKQGKTYLHRDGKYCCLGVLCAIAGIESSHETQGVLDDSQMNATELTLRQHNDLYIMNDGVRGQPAHSFAEIADYIEANL